MTQVQPPPPVSSPTTTISVHLSYPWMGFMYALCRPRVLVDGREVASGWGEHQVPIPVGSAELAVHVRYLGAQVGWASFPLIPGGPTVLQYRAPYWVLMRGDLGVTAHSRGGVLMGVVTTALVLAALVPLVFLWRLTSQVDGLDADGSTGLAPSPAALVEGATSFLLEPTGDDVDSDVVAGTAGLLVQRLAGTGAEVTVDGDGVRVTFPTPPAPEVVAHLTDPTDVTFRPVLAVAGPDPFQADGGGGGATDQATDPSDADFYLTGQVLTAFGDLDCTVVGTPPFVSPEGAMVACDAAGSAKFALGPVEVTGDMVAAIEAGPPTLPDGGVGVGQVVTMTFDADGTSAFREATTRLMGLISPANQIAIVVDGQVVSAPAVHEVIPIGEVQLSGGGDDDDDAFTTLVAQLLFGRPGSTWQVTSSEA